MVRPDAQKARIAGGRRVPASHHIPLHTGEEPEGNPTDGHGHEIVAKNAPSYKAAAKAAAARREKPRPQHTPYSLRPRNRVQQPAQRGSKAGSAVAQ